MTICRLKLYKLLEIIIEFPPRPLLNLDSNGGDIQRFLRLAANLLPIHNHSLLGTLQGGNSKRVPPDPTISRGIRDEYQRMFGEFTFLQVFPHRLDVLGVAHPAENVLFAGGGGAVVDVADAVDYAGGVVGVAALI